LLIINELGKKGGEKKGVTNLYLPQNHYKIEMAILALLGVLVHIGEKVVTDCDIMGVDGRMGGGFVMMVAESLHCQKPGAELRATPAEQVTAGFRQFPHNSIPPSIFPLPIK